jgi:hypothetical protein
MAVFMEEQRDRRPAEPGPIRDEFQFFGSTRLERVADIAEQHFVTAAAVL